MTDIQLHPIHIKTSNDRVFKSQQLGGLTDEFVAWMDEQIGTRGSCIDQYADWYIDPKQHHMVGPNNTGEWIRYYTIWLKDPKHHLMMKLTWGGA